MSKPHFTRLSAQLTRLRENGHLLDASIPTQTTSVALHRLVIALFSQEIRHKLIQTGKCDLSLEDYSHATVDNIIQFLYGGEGTIGPLCTELIQTLHLDLSVDKTITNRRVSKDSQNTEDDDNIELKYMRILTFEMEVPRLLEAQRPLADVQIQIATHIHKCHKVILSAMSEYFEVMFSSGMKEARDEIITLHGIKNNVFKDVLNFLYTGHISINSGNAQAILSTAVYLQITSLQSICEQFLLPTIDNTNCIDLFKYAETYNCVLLQAGCWDYILDHFLEIKTLKLVKCLQLNDIHKLIKDDNLHVNSENDVLKFVLHWIENNKDTGSLENLLTHVRLSQLETEQLKHLICHKFVESNPQQYALVKELLDARSTGMCPSQHTRKEKCLLVMKRCWITRGIEMACYSLSRKSWYRLNTFPSIAGGSGYASCCSKTNVYVTGGNQTLRSFYNYSTALNAWTELSEMNENRCSHAMGCVNDVVYVLGGSDKSYNRETGGWNALCSIEKFDPKVNQWITLKAKLNIPVFDSAYASVKSKIFMFGGSLGSKVGVYLKDIQCFDIALETCTTLYHHLPMTLSLGAACTNNNDVYIVCPNGNVIHFNEETSPPKVFYESTKSQLLGFTAVFNENKILVMGGYSSIGETDVVRKIDILRKNSASVDETRLPFEKNSNELFAAVMHVDRRFLMAEIERNKKTPRGKGQKRI